MNKNLVPSIPRLRENTKTSAPSLIVLVLKPFPSERSRVSKLNMCCDQQTKSVDSKQSHFVSPSKPTLSNGILKFALYRITQGHAMPHLIWVHSPTIICQQFKIKVISGTR